MFRLLQAHTRLAPRKIYQHPATLWSLSIRLSSTAARPFTFHIGVSWAAKPPDPESTRFHTAFSADSQLGKWRDATLSHPEHLLSKDAGEDFFYHTEARPLVFVLLSRSSFS